VFENKSSEENICNSGGYSKYTEKLCNLYSSPTSVRIVKCKR